MKHNSKGETYVVYVTPAGGDDNNPPSVRLITYFKDRKVIMDNDKLVEEKLEDHEKTLYSSNSTFEPFDPFDKDSIDETATKIGRAILRNSKLIQDWQKSNKNPIRKGKIFENWACEGCGYEGEEDWFVRDVSIPASDFEEEVKRIMQELISNKTETTGTCGRCLGLTTLMVFCKDSRGKTISVYA